MGKRWVVYGRMDPTGDRIVKIGVQTVMARELGRVEEGARTPKPLRDVYQEAIEEGLNISWPEEEPDPEPESILPPVAPRDVKVTPHGSGVTVETVPPHGTEEPPVPRGPEPELPPAPTRPARGKSSHKSGHDD